MNFQPLQDPWTKNGLLVSGKLVLQHQALEVTPLMTYTSTEPTLEHLQSWNKLSYFCPLSWGEVQQEKKEEGWVCSASKSSLSRKGLFSKNLLHSKNRFTTKWTLYGTRDPISHQSDCAFKAMNAKAGLLPWAAKGSKKANPNLPKW